MKAHSRLVVLVFGLIVLALGAPPSWAQMILSGRQAGSKALASVDEGTSGRSVMDESNLEILFVRPWAKSPQGLPDGSKVFLLKYRVGSDFVLNDGEHVVLLGSSDDVIEANELKITDVTELEPGEHSLEVDSAQLSLLQGLGRGNLVLSLVVVDENYNPVQTADQEKLIGDLASICTGYEKNPVDLRIMGPGPGDLEDVNETDLSDGYLIDADKTDSRQLNPPPATTVPSLRWDAKNQCQGELADLTDAWVNEVRLAEDDTAGGPSKDLRCSVNQVAFDIWYVEDAAAGPADVASEVDTLKLKDPLAVHGDETGSGYFRLYSSPLSTMPGNPMTSLDESTNFPNEVGELGDPVYGVWGYWGNAPLSRNNLYNMVARIEREGRIRLENRYLGGPAPERDGRLFLYVYDPAWYGVRWAGDSTQWKGHWIRIDGFTPQVQDGHTTYDIHLENNVLELDGSPAIPGYELAVVGPDSAPWYDPTAEGPEKPAPAHEIAGTPITVTLNATELGNCPDPVAAVVTYADPDDDVDLSGELASKGPDTSREARLEVLSSNVDQTKQKYRGVYKIDSNQLGTNIPLTVMLPSSVHGVGTIKVLLVPWQQVEDGDLIDAQAKGGDLYKMTGNVRQKCRLFSERDRMLQIEAVADVGFNATEETFPWPDPFFQKNNKEYRHKGVQLFNAGVLPAEVTLQVLLVKASAKTDFCTASVEPSWARELAGKTIDLESRSSFQTDISYTLPTLHSDENRVVIRLLGTGDGGNMRLRCVERVLVAPLDRNGLLKAYTVYGRQGDQFTLKLRTNRGGPGFTAKLDLVPMPGNETPDSVVLKDAKVVVEDATSSVDENEATLQFDIAGNANVLASHQYYLRMTTDDLFSEPVTAKIPLAVNMTQAPPSVDGSEPMTVLPVVAAQPGVGGVVWKTAAWFFNQENKARTYEVGYVITKAGVPGNPNNQASNVFLHPEQDHETAIVRRLRLEAKGRPNSLRQYDDILDQLFGIVTASKGWIYVKPVTTTGTTVQDPWPAKFPMMAGEVYSVAEVSDPNSDNPIVASRGQFVVAQPLNWVAVIPTPLRVALVIPGNDGDHAISTRVNLHLTVFGDQEASFKIVALNDTGDEIWNQEVTVPPRTPLYVSLGNSVHPARLNVEPVGPDGVKYSVMVSQVDNDSDDPISLPGRTTGLLGSGGDRVIVPVIARLPGKNNSFWVTDLTLANTGNKDVTYGFRFFPTDGEHEIPNPPMAPVSLLAGQTLSIHDVCRYLDPNFSAGKGLLLVEIDGPGKDDVLVTSRTYTLATCEGEDGTVPCTYGQRVPGYAATPQVLTAGSDAGVIFALDLRSNAIRESFGLANVGDKKATAVLRLMDHEGAALQLKGADGSQVISMAVTVDLAPHALRQNELGRLNCEEDTAPCLSSFFSTPLVPLNEQVDSNGMSLLQGCLLEVAAQDGELTAYVTRTDNVTNDSLFIPVVQPEGYGTALPDSQHSAISVAEESSEVGAWERVDITLRDSNGRPLPGYSVTVKSSRPYYFRFEGAGDGLDYPQWQVTDADGRASFEVTSHAPGISSYSVEYAKRSTVNADGGVLSSIDLDTSVQCEWQVRKIESAVAEDSVVGRNETMTVTLKEADDSPVWPGFTVELSSDRLEDTPSDSTPIQASTNENGEATFTVHTKTIGLSKWSAVLYNQSDQNTVGDRSETTVNDETSWRLDEAASTVVMGNSSPVAGTTDGSDCNGDGIVDTGETVQVTVTLMGENNQPVVNARVELNKFLDPNDPQDYAKETILTSMPVITDSDGMAVFQVIVPPVNDDVPITVTHTATVSPNSGTSEDPVQTVGTAPSSQAAWQDESPANIGVFQWLLTNGFLTDATHQLDFDAHECIGHVDAFDVMIQRVDDGRYWNPTSQQWISSQAWFSATGQPQLDPAKEENTWNGNNNWGDLTLDMANRSNAEGFLVVWTVRATDGGGNTSESSNASNPIPVDYLVPEITGGFVSREGAGIGGDLPVAGEGFDIWSTAREYNPASGESWYQLQGGGASGNPTAAPSAALSGSPDVLLQPVTVSSVTLGGDQELAALGGRLLDQAAHDSSAVLRPDWAVFVRPLSPDGFQQGEADNPNSGNVGCGATGLNVFLQRNSADPAVARSTLQYAFLLDADGNGAISAGDYWLAVDSSGNRIWRDQTTGPVYRIASGWGVASGDWANALALPVNDANGNPVMPVTSDHQILVYAHNPQENVAPKPGEDPNTVSDPATVVTEGLPTIETFVLGNGDAALHECETGGIHGTFSDDDGQVAEVRLLIQSGNEYFDGASNQWVTTETWFTVSHDDAAHTWSWPIPHELLAGHVNHDVRISVLAVDNAEGTCTACQGEIHSCNTPTLTATLANDDPAVAFDNASYPDMDDDQAVTGTMSDSEYNSCGDASDYSLQIQIEAADSGKYWNGSAWQSSATWVPITVVDWTAGTWSYTLPSGFHDHLGGSNVTLKVETTDDLGATTSATSSGNIANIPPQVAPDSYSTNEDTQLTVVAPGVLQNDTDVDGVTLTAVLDTTVSHGTLTLNSDGSFTFTPAANYNGTDSFTYHANDGHADSATVTVTITVNAVNDPPVAAADSYSTNEDTQLTVAAPGVLTNDTDVDGDALTAVLDATVSHGTLTLNSDGSFSYTPAANYNGTDSFTYHANDGHADSATVTVTITVNAVNDPPTTTGISDQTNNDGDAMSLNVSTSFTDPDGDALSYSASGLPGGLTIGGITGVIGGTIAADASASSPYTVTVTANDGNGGTVSTSFTWTVNNPAPVVTIDGPSPFVLNDGTTIAGTVVDDDTISGVTLTIEDTDAGLFWDQISGTWAGIPSNNPATGTNSWTLILGAGFHTLTNSGHNISVVAASGDGQGAVGFSPAQTGTIAP
ncbi:MAG: tandem-95 repeat protein [Acidobacteria bacterium]|nr:tandem-95 repeat protein [Acidobacteriota bacterium]